MASAVPVRLSRLALAAALLLPAVPAQAQREDNQLWLQVNTNVPLTGRTRLTLEQIARWGDRANGLYQTEFGGILGYKLSSHVEIGVGYRKVGMYNSTARDEDRIRQHVVVTYGHFTGRLRVDERFHPAGDEIGFRIRPLIRYNLPIAGSKLALFGSHESFILPNSTAWGQRSGYERMRNILGLTVPIGKSVSADVGYLNQFRPARYGARAQMDHALTLQLTINPKLAPLLHD